MQLMAKTPKELDRLAWKQRLEEIDRERLRIRRKEWMYDHASDVVLTGLLTLVLLSIFALILGG